MMQKMMQGVPEYIVVPELRNAINVVKSDLRPIDTRYVNQTISEIKDKCKKQIKDIKIVIKLKKVLKVKKSEKLKNLEISKKNN